MEFEFNIFGNSDCSKPQDIELEEGVPKKKRNNKDNPQHN